MKKKASFTLGGIVVVLGGLVFYGQAWLKGRFQKDAVVQQLEQQWNCRAELDSSTATFLSSPAKVELNGLKLAPPDAESQKPPGQRAPLDPKAVLASIDHTELSIELWDLLHGQVNVKKLRFDGLGLKGEVSDDGKSSLQALFSSPDRTPRVVKVGSDKEKAVTVNGDGHAEGVKVVDNGSDKKNKNEPASPQEQNKGDHDKPKSQPQEEKKPEPFKAGNMPVSLQVDEAGIHNGRVEITDHAHGTHSLLERMHFDLKAMDVNPSDLAHHDSCKLDFGGALKLEQENTATSTADLEVNGSGVLKPFDAESGEWNPDLTVDLLVKKGSQLGGTLMKDNMKKKDAAKLKEYGIDLGDIALGGVLGEDVTTEAHMFNGKLLIKKDTRLVFPQYEITLKQGSWFNSSQDSHKANGILIVNADLSARVMDQAKKKFADRYGSDLASLADTVLKGAFFNAKNQLEIPFKSSGSMSKPDMSLDNALGSLNDLLKKTGTSTLLNELLGK